MPDQPGSPSPTPFSPTSYIEGVEETFQAFISVGASLTSVEAAMNHMGMSPSGRKRIMRIWKRDGRV